ncbi:MAG: GNAT family N-acetyltransferase [Candidatus Euphemobacter frigidus]|nr:GNAT family N-acetyltransferase [Candidatus Euphemobacter frigidus]MDP8275131.1 GNAT family N-acetyltransferase [Candidatus Euphemobacter frigidus]
MKKYEILPWDTQFFGFGVAKIVPSRLTADSLGKILKQLKKENISLVYWPSDINDEKSQEAGRKLGGFLADSKTTFFADLTTLDLSRFKRDPNVQIYSKSHPTKEMEDLAIACGRYSRFHQDPKIGEAKYRELYKLWLKKSLAGITAGCFWVYPNKSGKIIGMLSMKIIGDIVDGDLGAVNKSERGKGIGEALFVETFYWSLENGYKYMQLITQGRNKASCSLYKKFGFEIVKVENFYHFWI